MSGDGLLEFERPLAELEHRIQELRQFSADRHIDLSDEIRTLEQKAERLRQEIFSSLSPWQRVQIARHPRRPYFLDYAALIFEDFLELHGDREYGDDPALIGGLALLGGQPVTVLGQQKGRDTRENLARNFGMPYPEGYRKALRLMQQAEKFGRPVLAFIDTPGAFPGLEAEKRGQAEAIAHNIQVMAGLRVPIVAVIIGEGGSGGALAIGVGDRVLMLENSIYSVISPEACAAILWRDAGMAKDAAAALRLSAPELLKLGVVDEVVPEPLGGAHRDVQACAATLKAAILRNLEELRRMDIPTLLEKRYHKYRAMG
ncbi:MAG: acetyl-CoA carboxylase carboxyltransferase subunit alpha, partial [Firmicutes bacterium]|nr:acetyl-CoA carboxylase carboxyltransferase subunit alpha [Bacillota bacterium]